MQYITPSGSQHWPLFFRPKRLDLQEWLAQQMAHPPRPPVRRQHLVSQALLRQFSGPGKPIKIGTYHLEWKAYKEKAPKSCGYLNDWTTSFTGEMEQAWQPTENLIPSAIAAIMDGRVLGDPALLTVLKRTIAIHRLRSHTLRRFGQSAADEAIAESLRRLTATQAVRRYLAQEFRALHGREAASEDDLRSVLVDKAKGLANWDPAINFRKKMDESFEDLKRIVDQCNVEILRAPPGRHFILGDTPVFLVPPAGRTRRSRDLPLFDSQFMILPVHPDYCLRLPTKTNSIVAIGHRDLERINDEQIANAYRYVYFTPDARTLNFVNAKAKRWRPPPVITELVAR
ncbi:DUF4238 domain-containing protein [Micromonospora maris]|uniref:DUF4238 domain-containing protein n=1 Tax=Micromonospora maris TaxID=1003110 RepID=UPI002E11DC98|nr:DUF4238 domain-containing protein [Micromonospora maris]